MTRLSHIELALNALDQAHDCRIGYKADDLLRGAANDLDEAGYHDLAGEVRALENKRALDVVIEHVRIAWLAEKAREAVRAAQAECRQWFVEDAA